LNNLQLGVSPSRTPDPAKPRPRYINTSLLSVV
jgi:hypothetical protein